MGRLGKGREQRDGSNGRRGSERSHRLTGSIDHLALPLGLDDVFEAPHAWERAVDIRICMSQRQKLPPHPGRTAGFGDTGDVEEDARL